MTRHRPKKQAKNKKKSKRGPAQDSKSGRPKGSKKGPKKGYPKGRSDRNDRGPSRPGKSKKSPGRSGSFQSLTATLDKNRKGFGFLIFDDRELEDLFLPAHTIERFFHGDRLKVRVSGSDEVLGIILLEHRYKQLIGNFMPHPSKPDAGWINYESRKFQIEIPITKMKEKPKVGDWIKVNLHFHETGREFVTAELIEVFADVYPATEDLEMIAGEFGLEEKHTPAAVKLAQSFGKKVTEADIKSRKDLRNIPFVTIDGEDARDFDDAVYVKKEGSVYHLWVAIADVSHYVKPGNDLDREAFERCNSTYFPERAFHMLPEALSANLCSLVPKQDRLALVCKMTFDLKGKIQKTLIDKAVIYSHRRATYTEVYDEYTKQKENSEWDFYDHFKLFELLEADRKTRGSLDFEFPEAKVELDDQAEPIKIETFSRNEAHRLIETFMIAANESVTTWAQKHNLPFIYRVHETPDESKIQDFYKFARTAGFSSGGGTDISSKKLSKLLKRLETHPSKDMLSMLLLRSLKQAVYSPEHDIHFGLASAAYTHFTSPIRRYSDLVVHRILCEGIKSKSNQSLPDEGELMKVAQQCSYKERLSSDAERECKRIKQVRLMMKHLGDDFEGKIIGMNDQGFFVQIASPFVEGMVPKDSLNDDSFEFDPERMIYAGRRKNRLFKMGQVLRVQVVRADLPKRRVEFLTLEQ